MNQNSNRMKKVIKTSNAPMPIGPYNQGIITNGTLFISGQIAINPVTNQLENKDIQTETLRVMQNLKAVLNEAGMDFGDVVKSSIFLSDMNNFSDVNEVYGSFFDQETAPARETVQVSRLPKDANVEISMIAVKS